jgi:predicted nucleic acid-binding protein
LEAIVVDSDVLVASFLESEPHHAEARHYIDALENGDCIFHLPMLVPVEVVSAIWRRTQKLGVTLVTRARISLQDWESTGKMLLYPLNRERMDLGMDAALNYRLRGTDSIVASLADELSMPLRTFDHEMQRRSPRASL